MLTRTSPGVVPAAILRTERDLPMVEIAPGLSVQLLQVDFDHNIRITRSILAPGTRLRTHLHSGHVYAWTLGGTWKYEEHAESSTANSFLYEPAGSDHTLTVPADSGESADVVFIVHGSNIEKDDQGRIVGVTDAAAIARAYLDACERRGLPRPDVIGLPPDWQG